MSLQPSSAGASTHNPLRADLHTHSTASDGIHAPADLLQLASRRGLSILALTDHDTTLGIPEAARAARELGITFIPGIELSTDVREGETHVLGYGIDPESGKLQTTLARLRESRQTRAARILERLERLGITLSKSSIQPTQPGASIGRPHIARALIEAGHAATTADAFDRYLGAGKPAYVRSERLEPADAVRLICSAGGLAVLAHPFSSPGFPHTLHALIEAGLRGLEVYYGEYDEDRRHVLADIADERRLIATGGSDFHAEGFKEGRDLGSVQIPEEAVRRFLYEADRPVGQSRH